MMFSRMLVHIMLNFFIFFISLKNVISSSVNAKPKASILVLTQAIGLTGTGIETPKIAEEWQRHLNQRFVTISPSNSTHSKCRLSMDSSWPFNATVELLDTKSDPQVTQQLLVTRINNPSLPPVLAVTGPETKSFTPLVSIICGNYNIPFVSSSNGKINYPPLPMYATSFFVSPQFVYQSIELINAYADQGVKTLVTVAMMDASAQFKVEENPELCFGSGYYAETKGITLLANISLHYYYTRDQIKDIIREIRDVYDPDAIMWCDVYSTVVPDLAAHYHPITMFKEINYLPKALSLMNALDAVALDNYKQQGLYLYVTSGAFVSDKVTGRDFTEGDTPYSSRFRPSKPVNSIYDELNFGATADSLSSTKQFYQWYRQATGGNPIYQAAALWATFDVIEAAIYRAANLPKKNFNDPLTAGEVLYTLNNMQLTTPLGRVIFDNNHNNIAFNSLFIQARSITDTADIVYPRLAHTADLVYPMPTWDDRVYTWRLIGDGTVRISIAVATACSLLILAIAITVIVYRKEPEVRMLHYLHVVSLCLAALLLVWSLVFLWQRDNSSTQCGAFMWTVFLPASYMVHLVNMKAYRLSLFVVASATGRRPRPFSHLRVFCITLSLLFATAIVLAIVASVIPPVRTKVIADIHRLRLDEYHCVFGAVGKGLLFFLVVAHFLASMLSVMAVRNGMEDFRDGLVMKEAFTILYMCLGVAFVMSRLQLESSMHYLLRSVILSVGVTLFLFRLLASRVVKHWLPSCIRKRATYVYDNYLKSVMASVNASSSVAGGSVASRSMASDLIIHPEHVDFSGGEYEDGPAYHKEVPRDDKLQEMISVLKDSRRIKIFQEVADKALNSENIEFLTSVMQFEERCDKILIQYSSHASDQMRAEAAVILGDFVAAKAVKEVNVSSGCRSTVEKSLQQWILHSPLLNEKTARDVLETDCVKRYKMFQPAFKEISIMTYQNLWNRFRTAETNYLAMGGDEFAVKEFVS